MLKRFSKIIAGGFLAAGLFTFTVSAAPLDFDAKAAVAEYTQKLQAQPNNAVLYNNRGVAYKMLEQYQKALEDLNRAIQLDPNYSDAYNNRGTVYDKLNQNDKAISDYSRAIQLNPQDIHC